MTNDELDTRLAMLAPIEDREVEALDLGEAEAELLAEIVATPLLDDVSVASRRRFEFLRKPGRPLAAAAAVAAAVAALILIGFGSGPTSSRPEFAEAAIRVAQANPRLLVTAPGWEVTRADEFELDYGEMAFGDGEHELTVHWYPADHYQGYYRDRTPVDRDPLFFELLGQRTRTVSYSVLDHATMLPPMGGVFVEIRGDLPLDEYRAVVETIEPTDVETWLAAMPAGVVRPDDRATTVAEMLADVPLPPRFAVEKLEAEDAVLTRYQLGARVTGAVACEWLDRWVEATDRGDRVATQEAAAALATSREWAILDEMESEGGWSPVLREYALAPSGGQYGTGEGWKGVGNDTREFQLDYAAGLGCREHRIR